MATPRAPRTNRFSFKILHHLKHHTPKRPAGTFELAAARGVAFAAHKPHGLAVPVLHKVEAYAAGKTEGEPWEGEESVTEIGGQFVLLEESIATLFCFCFGRIVVDGEHQRRPPPANRK
jgi:hypothetical protein